MSLFKAIVDYMFLFYYFILEYYSLGQGNRNSEAGSLVRLKQRLEIMVNKCIFRPCAQATNKYFQSW